MAPIGSKGPSLVFSHASPCAFVSIRNGIIRPAHGMRSYNREDGRRHRHLVVIFSSTLLCISGRLARGSGAGEWPQ